MSKPFWQSKTFWINLLAIVGALVGGDAMGAEVQAEVVAVIMGAVNLVLRYMTDTGVTLKGGD